jgi:superfamily I DNA/RNA helicase
MSVAKSLLEQRVHLGILNSSEAKTNLVKSKRLRKKQPSHLIIEARAGTGKTTTLIEGLKKLKGIKSDHPAAKNPSPQQKDIWNQLLLSKDALSIAFIAFNKSIADELRSRVPSQCEAMTCHSLGYKSVLNTYSGVSLRRISIMPASPGMMISSPTVCH